MINLDFRDSRPVYEQIKDKIKNLIVSGALKSGDRIMSVREMAAALTINPNTIVKAYKELEADGYIYSVKGKGYYVADSKSVLGAGIADGILESLEKQLTELCYLGIKKEEIDGLVEKIWKGMIKND